MGRHSCCVKQKLRKGLWSPEEDEKLFNYITRYGVGCWSSVPKLAGLERCGKSCRLRWINYLRPDLKRGMFSQEEEDLIISLHEALGNRWAQIAAQLPGRTDNEIKNFWNSSLKKKLMKQGIDPNTHKPIIEATDFKDEKDVHSQGIPDFNNILCTSGASSKQVYDPLFLSEYQASVDPSNFLTQINSMTNLTNFDPPNIMDTGYLMNEAKQSSKAKSHVVENSAFSWDAENKLDPSFQFQFSGIQIEEKKASSWQDHQSSGNYSNFPVTTMPQEWTSENMDVFQHI